MELLRITIAGPQFVLLAYVYLSCTDFSIIVMKRMAHLLWWTNVSLSGAAGLRRQSPAAEALPDDPGDHHEDDIQVT